MAPAHLDARSVAPAALDDVDRPVRLHIDRPERAVRCARRWHGIDEPVDRAIVGSIHPVTERSCLAG
jgi:hypothetical protein